MRSSAVLKSDGQEEIVGVVFKELKTYSDDRGFFRELVRKTDPFFSEGFGQWSHSHMAQNTVKAWHFHHLQTDYWYCPAGVIEVALFDDRSESPTYEQRLHFFLGDASVDARVLPAIVKIPPGVLHGCKALTPTADLFYITSHTYNPEDEGRLPFDSPRVGFHWGDEAELVIAEKDRRPFTPPYPRREYSR